jgi:hypothetical protein
MRIGLFFALLLLSSPALADITARYRQMIEPGEVVVQANDRGESRMTVTDAAYVTTAAGTHMILTDRQGTYVARQDDFLSLLDALSRATQPDAQPAASRPLAIREEGSETVAGRTGTKFRISLTEESVDAFEVVISTDPELAPLGRVVAAHFAPFFRTTTRAMPGLAEAVTDLLGRGTLLRFGPLFQLESLDAAPIPASAFALPSAPLSREALAARLSLPSSPMTGEEPALPH